MFTRLATAFLAFGIALLSLFIPVGFDALWQSQAVEAAPSTQEFDTVESVATPTPSREVRITLNANSLHVNAGDAVDYTLLIENATESVLREVVFQSDVPLLTTLVPQLGSSITQDKTGALRWNLGDVAPGTTFSTTFQLQTDNTITDAVIAQWTATSPDLPAPLVEWEIVTVGQPSSDGGWISPEGGTFTAEIRPVTLLISENTISEPLFFQISAGRIDSTAEQFWTTFDLTAQTIERKPVASILAPATVSVDVSAYMTAVLGTNSSPTLYRFDETKGTWEPLVGTMYWDRWTLSAQTNQFGTFAIGLGGTPSYGLQHLPTMHGYSPDEFSGNSSYQYPFILPPGPAGFGLNLGLSYSSEGVNSIVAGRDRDWGLLDPIYRQASIAGWGWNLTGLGQITREINDEPNVEDRFFINFGGGSYELKPADTTGNVRRWYTYPQSYIRVESHISNGGPGGYYERATNWHVWTPDGTHYIFGSTDWNDTSVGYYVDPVSQAGDLPEGVCIRNRFREAHLRDVYDVNGNHITVTYDRELDPFTGTGNNCSGNYVRAIRPTWVKYYPSGVTPETVRIQFAYVARQDTQIFGWGDPYAQILMSNQRLASVTASVRDGSTNTYSVANGYQFDVDYDPLGSNSAESIMMMDTITATGSSGGEMKPHLFTYTTTTGSSGTPNFNVLTTINNSQGGVISYTYAKVTGITIRGCGTEPWIYASKRFRVTDMDVNSGFGDIVHHDYYVLPSGVTDINQSAFAHGEYDLCLKNFEFGGYKYSRHEVTHEFVNPAGQTITRPVQNTVSHFYQSTDNVNVEVRKGRPYLVQSYNADSPTVLLAEQATTWSVANDASTRNIEWVYKANEENRTFGAGGTVVNRKEYQYDTAQQGSGNYQYGNLTDVREYANGTLIRTQEMTYTRRVDFADPPTNLIVSRYITNRLIDQRLYQGTTSPANLIGKTLYAYDNLGYVGTLGTLGRLTNQKSFKSSSDTVGVETDFGYDVYGNQTTVIDPLGRVTSTAYDTTGWKALYVYPKNITSPQVGSTTFTTQYLWNLRLGQVERMTDTNNAVTIYAYDQFARLDEVWQPLYGRVQYDYLDYTSTSNPYRVQVNTLLNVTTGVWNYQHIFYDGLGRQIESRSSYKYEAAGNQHNVTYMQYHPSGGVAYSYATITATAGTTYIPLSSWVNKPYTYSKYDSLGRVIALRSTDNLTTTSTYQTENVSGLGILHRVEVVDTKGNYGRQYMDALGRMVLAKEMSNATTTYADTRYAYSANDLLTSVTDAQNNVSTMQYDWLGRKTYMDDPDMGVWQYAYDNVGNMIAQLDSRQNGICFQFDAHNRITRKRVYLNTSLPNTQACLPSGFNYEATYTYDQDLKGFRSGMTDPTGSTSWDYDVFGRVIREDKTIIHNSTNHNFATSYQYDQIGRMKTMTYMPGLGGTETVNYTYDAPYIGALTEVASSSPAISYASNIRYNPFGQMTAMTYGTSTPRQIQYSYHPLAGTSGSPGESQGRLHQILIDGIWNRLYSYDTVGNVEKIVSHRPSIDYQENLFTYDHRNRLIDAESVYPTTPGYYDESYSYDTIGNMMTKNGVSYTYSPSQPHAVTSLSNNKTYIYDAVGNQQYRRYYNMGGTQLTDTLTYDGENRLISIDFGDSVIQAADYNYDGDGNRVKATINGQTTLYVGAHIEYRITGNVLVKYYYAGSQRIAMKEGINLPYFFVSDHLGSTSLTLSQNGNVYSEMRYKPFGETAWSSTANTPTQRRYTGQIQDFDSFYTDLYFYNARYYDPELARFTQADTIVPKPGNPQALNRFSYTLNNPVKYTDPSGHFSEDAIKSYLMSQYGDSWQYYYDLWESDESWWAMIRAAEGGESLALILEDGTVQWYKFDGVGQNWFYGMFSTGGPDGLHGMSMSAASIEGVRQGRFQIADALFGFNGSTLTMRKIDYNWAKLNDKFAHTSLHVVSDIEAFASEHILGIGGAIVGSEVAGPVGGVLGTIIGYVTEGLVEGGLGLIDIEPLQAGDMTIMFSNQAGMNYSHTMVYYRVDYDYGSPYLYQFRPQHTCFDYWRRGHAC